MGSQDTRATCLHSSHPILFGLPGKTRPAQKNMRTSVLLALFALAGLALAAPVEESFLPDDLVAAFSPDAQEEAVFSEVREKISGRAFCV